MKQVAQFKLKAHEQIAGMHFAKAKNQRRWLRARGIEPAFTTGSQVGQHKVKSLGVTAWIKEVRNRIDFAQLHRVVGEFGMPQIENLPKKASDRALRYEAANQLGSRPKNARDWRNLYYHQAVGDARNFRSYEPKAQHLMDTFARLVIEAVHNNNERADAWTEMTRAGYDVMNDEPIRRAKLQPGSSFTAPYRLFGAWKYNAESWDEGTFDKFTAATGWYMLGYGHFSSVWGNDLYPNIALKFGVSGSGSDNAYYFTRWAQEHQGFHGIPTVHALKEYTTASVEGPLAREFYLAVLDRLDPFDRGVDAGAGFAKFFLNNGGENGGFDVGPFWKAAQKYDEAKAAGRKWEWQWNSWGGEYVVTPDAFDMAALETWAMIYNEDAQAIGGSIDLHGGNVMKTKDGRVQFTDPIA